MIEKSGLVNPLCGGYCCHSLVYGTVVARSVFAIN